MPCRFIATSFFLLSTSLAITSSTFAHDAPNLQRHKHDNSGEIHIQGHCLDDSSISPQLRLKYCSWALNIEGGFRPDFALLYSRATAYRSTKQYSKAIHDLEKINKLLQAQNFWKDNYWAGIKKPNLLLTEIYLTIERRHDALTAAESALRIRPNDEDFLFLKAVALEGMGELTDALSIVNNFITLSSGNKRARGYQLRSWILTKTSTPSDALTDINKAIAIHGSGSAYQIRGDIYELMGKLDEAIESYEKAVSIDQNRNDLNKKISKLKDMQRSVNITEKNGEVAVIISYCPKSGSNGFGTNSDALLALEEAQNNCLLGGRDRFIGCCTMAAANETSDCVSLAHKFGVKTGIGRGRTGPEAKNHAMKQCGKDCKPLVIACRP